MAGLTGTARGIGTRISRGVYSWSFRTLPHPQLKGDQYAPREKDHDGLASSRFLRLGRALIMRTRALRMRIPTAVFSNNASLFTLKRKVKYLSKEF